MIQQTQIDNDIKHIVCIMSGKGGVGKSTITVSLADSLINQGYKVGILDADITCPAVPSLLNINQVELSNDADTIIPHETKRGLKVVSMNLLLSDTKQPVAWRGSTLSNIISKFWTNVDWGQLDYLLIDMPPGTSDIALTVLQHIQPQGIIIVSVPQDLVRHIVTKAIEMVNQMNLKIIGLILNMSYYTCPKCNEIYTMYDTNDPEFTHLKILGQLPATIDMAQISNSQGVLNEKNLKLFEPITKNIINELKPI
jgi:Mrp family chromosome partitioning ATPase